MIGSFVSILTVFGVSAARAVDCPREPFPRIVQIAQANPDVDFAGHQQALATLITELRVPNTTVVLGPDVVLDFTFANEQDLPVRVLPIRPILPVLFAPCTTLTSAPAPRGRSVAPPTPQASSRTPQSLGPLLKFGPHRSDAEKVLLEVNHSDHVRLDGFRLFGPSFGQQQTHEIGIYIVKSIDIEVSNLEVAGWGGQGIHVHDEVAADEGDIGRMEQPSDVRIFGNYIHHNQHPSFEGNSAGYGVEVNHGAWADIFANVFDDNRHAVMGGGGMGGYDAHENLVLKGGGVHDDSIIGRFYTHPFDIHGTGSDGFGGQAGILTTYAHDAFQYRNDAAISIRGRPGKLVVIRDNVFPHDGLEDDWGDDAITMHDRDDLDKVELGPNNVIEQDSYGAYGVCDFDGDQIDDLFLATGQTWWFSSFGEFQWTWLATRTETIDELAFGYFDGDLLCDVLTEGAGGEWVVASAGTAWWQSIGNFGVPFDEVRFGRFDPTVVDTNPGTKQTTHALHRMDDGQWEVTSLASPGWQNAASSGFPLSDLRFGDFTGDGVTDVLAVEGGEWSISDAAHGSWETINAQLDDDVSSLLMTDLDHDNVEDLIRVDRVEHGDLETITVFVSDDGRSPWRELVVHEWPSWSEDQVPPYWFAGRFGAAPGGGVLVVDRFRTGHFTSEAEIAVGASPQWTALFPY